MLSIKIYTTETTNKDNYFSKIESRFLQFIKNKKRAKNTKLIVTIFSLLSILISIHNIFKVLEFLYQKTGMIEYYSFPKNQGELSYLHMGIILLLVFLLFQFWKYVEKLLNREYNPESFSRQELAFCYISSTIKEIEFFRLNKLSIHLENAKENFLLYIENSENNFESNYVKTKIPIAQTLIDIKSSVSWLELSQTTSEIITAYASLEDKILNRLSERFNLSALQRILEELSLSIFAEIHMHRTENHPENSSVYFEIAREKLLSFCKKVNSLPCEKNNPVEKETSWLSKLNPKKLFNFYSHSNPIILLVALLLSLGVSVGVFITICLKLFSITMDSTLVAAYITVVVGGAITIFLSVWEKNK